MTSSSAVCDAHVCAVQASAAEATEPKQRQSKVLFMFAVLYTDLQHHKRIQQMRSSSAELPSLASVGWSYDITATTTVERQCLH